jgi:Methyltransferase domain
VTDGGSSIPAVQLLLAVLVASKPNGRIAELGTAFGEGAKAILDVLPTTATFVTVEPDAERYRHAAPALAGTRAEVLNGRWEELLQERGPFDVIFFDAGTRGNTLRLAVDLFAPGGILIKDDLTPGAAIDGDAVREAFLGDERLVGVLKSSLRLPRPRSSLPAVPSAGRRPGGSPVSARTSPAHPPPSGHYGVNSFQCPSETTSTAPSTTLMAV